MVRLSAYMCKAFLAGMPVYTRYEETIKPVRPFPACKANKHAKCQIILKNSLIAQASFRAYHAVHDCDVFGVTWELGVDIFTKFLDHWQWWDMIVIKWISLHTSIEMQRVIVFFYAQVVHLLITLTNQKKIKFISIVRVVHGAIFKKFREKLFKIYIYIWKTDSMLVEVWPYNDRGASSRARTWPARADCGTWPASALQGTTLQGYDHQWCRSCRDRIPQRAFAFVS